MHLWCTSGSNVECDFGDKEAAKTFYYGYVARSYGLLESGHVSPIPELATDRELHAH